MRTIQSPLEVLRKYTNYVDDKIDILDVIEAMTIYASQFQHKSEPVINPETHCPTCGSKCKVVGDVTRHYEQSGEVDTVTDEDVITKMRIRHDELILERKNFGKGQKVGMPRTMDSQNGLLEGFKEGCEWMREEIRRRLNNNKL